MSERTLDNVTWQTISSVRNVYNNCLVETKRKRTRDITSNVRLRINYLKTTNYIFISMRLLVRVVLALEAISKASISMLALPLEVPETERCTCTPA